MSHLLSSLTFLILLAGAGALVAIIIGENRRRIAAALRRAPVQPRPRLWSSRVRMTASSRPAAFRPAPRAAAA